MGKAIKMLAVCGNGMGSSLIVKMTLESVLSDLGVYGIIDCSSVAQARGLIPFSDVIITSTAFYSGIKDMIPEGKPVITCQNILDKKELTESVQKFIKDNYSDD
jgi:PTS system ascorbate-specific IIB component